MAGNKKEEDEETPQDAAKALPRLEDDSDSESSEDEDDLNLEGILVRNPDVSSSSSSDDDDDDDDGDADGEDGREGRARQDSKMPAKQDPDNSQKSEHRRKREPPSSKHQQQRPQKKKTQKQKKNKKSTEPEMIHVEFTFHDFDEKFFHGVKSLLHASSPVYQSHSSALTDLMIENVAVGTICSTEGDVDNNVFGFASVLNVTTFGQKPCIQYLKKLCLDKCPVQHKKEMEIVLSGKTARPAGFFFHGRMVNMPLEIVEVLHNQLVLDMDWAVKEFEGGEAARKALDFGAFVRLAPAIMDGGAVVYKFFDDEILATNSEFVYTMDAPKSYGSEEKHVVSVIVATKTGHRKAMKELKQLVGSGG